MDTPMLKDLKEYLENTSKEQIDKDWAEVKSLGLKGPTARELIKTFKMTQTKHFDKTLDEILEIISDINEELQNCLIEEDPFFTGLSCEFNEWWAAIKFQDIELFNTEMDEREYLEDIDDYEDLKDCIKRILSEKFSYYSQFKIQ